MRSYLFPLLLALPLSIFSQSQLQTGSIKIDSRLYEVFEKDYLEKTAIDDPFLIQRWNFYLDNAFIISDNALSKKETAADYPSVSIPDLKQINILKLEKEQKLQHDFYSETVYKIANTNQYLVYLAGKDFVEKLNVYLNKTKDK